MTLDRQTTAKAVHIRGGEGVIHIAGDRPERHTERRFEDRQPKLGSVSHNEGIDVVEVVTYSDAQRSPIESRKTIEESHAGEG